ncbi:MAG TPA: tetratricopeptide repeat protein [Drouetiella sp.]
MVTFFASSSDRMGLQLPREVRFIRSAAPSSVAIAITCLISCAIPASAQSTSVDNASSAMTRSQPDSQTATPVQRAPRRVPRPKPAPVAAPTASAATDAGTDATSDAKGSAAAASKSGTTGDAEASADSSDAAKDDDAQAETKAAIRKNLIQAGDLMLEGKYSEAADVYRTVLNLNSKDTNAIAGLGMALGRQFKLDAADEQFEKLLKIDPNNAVAHCGKAMVLLNRLQSSNNSVIKSRNQILKEAGKECNLALDADSRVVEAHYLLGRVFKEENRLDLASQAFSGAIKLDPHYSNAYAQLGLVRVLQNKLPEATEAFKKAISINSGNSTAHFGMAQVAFKQNKFEAAVAELNISLYQNPNSAPVHQLLGKVYEAQGNSVAAVKEYKEAIRIKPETVAAYLSVATVAEARGDMEMAIAELHAGLEVMPNEPELLLRLANDSLRIDKFDVAIKDFESAAAAQPSSAVPLEGLTRALYMKAQKEASGAYFGSSDYAQARVLVAKAMKLNPTDVLLRLVDAKLQALSGKPLNIANIPLPQTDADRPAYAETLMAQGKWTEAADQMSRAVNSTTDPQQLFAIADLALMIHDLPSAELAYKRAASFVGQAERANHGMDQIFKMREAARQNLNMANDLARNHQLESAIDKYRLAAYQDPRVGDTHLFLAQTIEKLSDLPVKSLKEAIAQYRAYLELTAGVPPSVQEKLQKRIAKLETKVARSEEDNAPAPEKTGLLHRLSPL